MRAHRHHRIRGIRRPRLALIACSCLSLAACGGGSDGPGTVTVSGTASYEFVPPRAACRGLDFDATEIRREFAFKGFYKTMGFVNAVAWIANGEGHHPDLEVGWGRCLVRYTTHAVDGLTENDFICAAKIDALMPD